MTKILHIILLLTISYSFGQVSKEVSRTIKPLEKYKTFDFINQETERIQEKVRKIAKSNELEYLALHGKSAYVKALAIEILFDRDDKQLFKVFKSAINSKDSISYTTEHLSSSVSLPAFFYENLTSNHKISKERQNKIKSKLVGLIIEYEPINIGLLNEIHYQIPSDLSYYEKIKNLVKETKSTKLLISLAKYQNKNDIELIKSFKENSFPAIEEFPDNDFLPFLENYLHHYNEFPYIFAVSKFCNEESADLVSKIIELKTENLEYSRCSENYCLEAFYNQIYMNGCKMYYPVLEKLWLSHKILSFDILDNFEKNHNKEETANFILSGLLLNGNSELISQNIYDIEKMLSRDIEEDLTFDQMGKLVKLLKKLKNLSEEKYHTALLKVILDIDDLKTADFIYKLNDSQSLSKCNDSFIEKMKNNESAYGLLVIMEGVKEIDDEKLFDECFKIIKLRREEFHTYPIWEQRLQQFLKENKLTL